MINKTKGTLIAFLIVAALVAGAYGLALKTNPLPDIEVTRTGEVITLAKGDFKAGRIASPDDALNALDKLSETYGFENAGKEFKYLKTIKTAFGKIFKFEQYHKGFAVYGRGLNINAGHNNEILSISGNYLKLDGVKGFTQGGSDTEILSFSTAKNILLDKYTEAEIISTGLCVYSLDGCLPTLAYNIMTDLENGTRIFIDAMSGGIITEISSSYDAKIPTQPYPSVQTDYFNNSVPVNIEKTINQTGGDDYYLADCLRNIYIYDTGNQYDTIGEAYKNKTGIFTDKIAVSAIVNLIKSFDFYKNPDNIGVSLSGANDTVNETHDDAEESGEIIVKAFLHYGVNYQNAGYMSSLREQYPNEVSLIFGDGISGGMHNPVVALDIVGHEYQHAVTAYAADLIYLNQSGALSEAYSDIFGALIEGYDVSDSRFWISGEDATNGTGTRSMANPSNGYRSHMNTAHSFCYKNHNHVFCDNGGVHYNSTIITHAAYRMYEKAPADFTNENIGTLWYSALGMLPSDAEFSEFQVLLTHCAELLGFPSQMINAITYGFSYVGLSGTGGNHTITFNRPSGFTGTLPASITLPFGEEFVINSTNLSASGKEILGWSEDGTGNCKVYYLNKSYRMPAYNLTLYPVAVYKIWNDVEPTILEGEGTQPNPYLISSEADLATIAYYLNNNHLIPSPYNFDSAFINVRTYYKLTKNLDLQNIPWIPIGLYGKVAEQTFGAVFDGDYHYIENLKINLPSSGQGSNYQGLFGYVEGGTIKNLGVKSGTINSYGDYIGAIAGYTDTVNITNCYNNADITNTNYSDAAYYAVTGGIIGYAEDTTISNCYNNGNITGPGNTGGIVGYTHSTSTYRTSVRGNFTIGNCYNTGTIKGAIVGGIASYITNTKIINCINTGNIINYQAVYPYSVYYTYYAGGIVASIESPNTSFNESGILGCKNTGVLTTASFTDYAGNLVGAAITLNRLNQKILFENNTYKYQSGLSALGNYADLSAEKKALLIGELGKSSTDNPFTGVFDFDSESYYKDNTNWVLACNVGIFDIGIEWQLEADGFPVHKKLEYWVDYKAESFAGGNGTLQSPYKISNAEELSLLAWLVNTSWEHPENSGYRNANYILTDSIDLAGKAWVGIGYTYSLYDDSGTTVGPRVAFNGALDGAGYTIYNMRARDYAFYSPTGIDSTELNAWCTTSAALFTIISSDKSSTNYNKLKDLNIQDCYNLAVSRSALIAHSSVAAGLVGSALPDFYPVNIKNCVVSGIIIGDIAAGIVGEIHTYSYNGVGISNCINNAAISGGVYDGKGGAGGILGRVLPRATNGISAKIIDCVNYGDVTSYNTGFTFIGGIVGSVLANSFTAENCINIGKLINTSSFGITGGIIGGINYTSGNAAYNPSKTDIIISGGKQLGDIKVYSVASTIRAGSIFGGSYSYSSFYNPTIIYLSKNFYTSNLPITGIMSAESSYISATNDGTNYHTTDSLNSGDFEFNSLRYFLIPLFFDNMTEDRANELFKMLNGHYPIWQYTYTFYDNDGKTILKSLTADSGTVIIPPADPEGYETVSSIYTFSHWNGFTEGMLLTENISFKAVYTHVLIQYTYTFYDEDGVSVLKTASGSYGTIIKAPPNPEKAPDEQYSYTFSHWEGFTNNMPMIKNISFKAVYTQSARRHTYTFYDYDGVTVLKTFSADYGTVIIPPINPEKEPNAQYTYAFDYWNGFTDGMTLTGNITFKAVYSSSINQYTYTFYDEDELTVLKALTIDYGTVITVPINPAKEPDAQYTYVFDYWDGFTDGMTLTGDITFKAVYSWSVNQYSYTFYNEDELTVLKILTIDYGTVITPPINPEKEPNAQYTYAFDYWSGFFDGMTLTGDITFKAVYSALVNQYKYTFYDEDELTVLKALTIDYGTVIVPPISPEKEPDGQFSYTFGYWYGFTEGMGIKNEISFKAVYYATENYYTYTFTNNGEIIKSVTAKYGTIIVAPANPSKVADANYTYTFSKWENFAEDMPLTENIEFTAIYNTTPVKITQSCLGCGSMQNTLLIPSVCFFGITLFCAAKKRFKL